MKNATDIVVLLDRSGSMETIKKDMQGAFNEFVKTQSDIKDDECTVNLYQFDTALETVYENRLVHLVPKLEISPRGGTALYDALAEVIDNTGHRLSKKPEDERPSRVVFVVITDGEENSSHKFSSEQVKERIKHQTEVYNWQFVYLGANQDAFSAASNIGINMSNTMNYAANTAGVNQMWSTVTSSLAAYRSMKCSSMSLNAKDKDTSDV